MAVNILMMTNTFTPFVGGVSRSVTAFTEELRRMGHRVVIVAPAFEHVPESETDVIRVPALQHFNGSDFAVVLPIPGLLSAKLEQFRPDVVHSHHPHLLGGTAVRIASGFECPLVFTYHTMYEYYLHYVPTHAKKLRQFVVNLVTGYCNLCDHLIVPSQSVAQIIRARGVATPLDVVPTGVHSELFARGDGVGFRRSHGIPSDAFVAGYVGRLAPEKNLAFLAESARTYVSRTKRGHFLVVGSGPSAGEIQSKFEARGVRDRLHFVGSQEGQELVDAYHAMDVFVFASQSETQGMVLTEAMAAGRPVVALDAPGVREVVKDGSNGHLLKSSDCEAFAAAIERIAQATPAQTAALARAAQVTAEQFSMERSAQKLARVYEDLVQRERLAARNVHPWHRAIEEIKAECELIWNLAEAATSTFK